MDISIVVPVSNDLRLKGCIDSIDENVELVISLNHPSNGIKDLITKILDKKNTHNAYKNIDIKVCEINYPSIAGAYNNGIEHAKYNKILLMDSDCTFSKGCIRKLNDNLGKNMLSKGKVIFQSNSKITKIVSKSREYHTSDKISAYSPPLLFDKKIKPFIGGYYFHPSLCWLEDSEFDNRVQKAGLNISYDPTATVFHPPLTPRKDLRSAFWYGVGKRIGVELGIHTKPTGLIGSVKKYLISASKSKGVATGIYLLIWKTTLLIGYTVQMLFRIRKET